jgi:glycosyltransferase involved in cell wall biosynthesis
MSGFRAVDRLAWRNYSHVFAISEEVRRRILLGRLCQTEKVSIAYPGVDLSHARPTGVYDRYFLVAGRIMWTKNHDLAIRAFQSFRRMRPDLRDFRLVIAGFVDQKSRPYLEYLRQVGGDCQNIEFVESPSDARLNDLYQRAYAVLYTPFNEDWGLIPLEAMAFEKPVLAVDRGGPRETIANGDTGFLLPAEPDAFAKTMAMLADDPQMARRMGAAGRLSTRRFEWKEFCNTMDDQLERVSTVNAPRRSAADSRAIPRPDAQRLNSEAGCHPER